MFTIIFNTYGMYEEYFTKPTIGWSSAVFSNLQVAIQLTKRQNLILSTNLNSRIHAHNFMYNCRTLEYPKTWMTEQKAAVLKCSPTDLFTCKCLTFYQLFFRISWYRSFSVSNKKKLEIINYCLTSIR